MKKEGRLLNVFVDYFTSHYLVLTGTFNSCYVYQHMICPTLVQCDSLCA